MPRESGSMMGYGGQTKRTFLKNIKTTKKISLPVLGVESVMDLRGGWLLTY